MSILSDNKIKQYVQNYNMITPFVDHSVRYDNNIKIISYGLSSYGYDARLGPKFQIFTNISCKIIDPKNFETDNIIEMDEGTEFIIPANSFALGMTTEYFQIPKDILTICVGKSTYARCGIVINVTPLEPEFKGNVVIELSNTTPCPVKIYPNEGICQFIFLKASDVCQTSYADRNGKYMHQKSIVHSKV